MTFDLTEKELRDWLVGYIGAVLGIAAAEFPTAARFDEIGLDSVEAAVMAGLLEERTGVVVDPVLFFESPSVDAFVAAHAKPAAGKGQS